MDQGWNFWKQPLRGVLLKRCSENMQQIYRRTPMPKCDFNKVALQKILDICFKRLALKTLYKLWKIDKS